MSQRSDTVSFGNVTWQRPRLGGSAAGDAASDTFDPVDGVDSSKDASWT
jgi:hypothetical protein